MDVSKLSLSLKFLNSKCSYQIRNVKCFLCVCLNLVPSWEIFGLLRRMCYPHVRCRSVAISWVQGRGLSRPWYIGLGQPSLWPNPRPLGPAPAQFSCVCLFLPSSAWLHLVSGLGQGQAKSLSCPQKPWEPSRWLLEGCVSCFDRSWDRIVAAGQSETNKLPRCCCGQWVQPMCPRCWVTLWSLHHGSPLGNTGHWRLCLDLASQIDNISDIYQTGNFNENKREPSATETEVNETSLFLFNGGESYNDSNQNALWFSIEAFSWESIEYEKKHFTEQRFRHWTLKFMNVRDF